MIDFSISNIANFTYAQKEEQVINCPWILLNLSGLKYIRVYHPDGSFMGRRKVNIPFLVSVFPAWKLNLNMEKIGIIG